VTTEDISGLWTVRPWLAIAMTVFMMALLGFPIAGGIGFFAKWYILKAALQADTPQITLSVVLVLTTVISAGYYLYVVMVMFMRPRRDGAPVVERTPGWTRFVMVACAAAILILGIMPDYAVSYAAVGQPVLSTPGDAAALAPPRPVPGLLAR
jgi:NADH-quinone oxidoreductase subunit N